MVWGVGGGKKCFVHGLIAVSLRVFVDALFQRTELNRNWEYNLLQHGILPPRSKHEPFLKDKPDWLKDRQIPVYDPDLYQFVEPGGKLDPYANPYPTAAEFASEHQRLRDWYSKNSPWYKRALGWGQTEDELNAEAKVDAMYEKERLHAARHKHWRYHRTAHYYRILAYAHLHDAEGVKLKHDMMKEDFDKFTNTERLLLRKLKRYDYLPIPLMSTPVYRHYTFIPKTDIKKNLVDEAEMATLNDQLARLGQPSANPNQTDAYTQFSTFSTRHLTPSDFKAADKFSKKVGDKTFVWMH